MHWVNHAAVRKSSVLKLHRYPDMCGEKMEVGRPGKPGTSCRRDRGLSHLDCILKGEPMTLTDDLACRMFK